MYTHLHRVRRKIAPEFVSDVRKLPSFIEQMSAQDPGGVYKLDTVGEDGYTVLRGVFVMTSWQRSVLQRSRGVVSVDGACLRTAVRPGVLVVVAIADATGSPLLLAVGLIQTENEVCWTFVLKALQQALGADRELYLVSDLDRGIKAAASKIEGIHFAWCTAHATRQLQFHLRPVDLNLLKIHMVKVFTAGTPESATKYFALTVQELHVNEARALEWFEKNRHLLVESELGWGVVLRLNQTTSNVAEQLNHCLDACRRMVLLDMFAESTKYAYDQLVKREQELSRDADRGLAVPQKLVKKQQDAAKMTRYTIVQQTYEVGSAPANLVLRGRLRIQYKNREKQGSLHSLSVYPGRPWPRSIECFCNTPKSRGHPCVHVAVFLKDAAEKYDNEALSLHNRNFYHPFYHIENARRLVGVPVVAFLPDHSTATTDCAALRPALEKPWKGRGCAEKVEKRNALMRRAIEAFYRAHPDLDEHFAANRAAGTSSMEVEDVDGSESVDDESSNDSGDDSWERAVEDVEDDDEYYDDGYEGVEGVEDAGDDARA